MKGGYRTVDCRQRRIEDNVNTQLERIRAQLYDATPESRISAENELSSMEFETVLGAIVSSLDKSNDDARFAIEALLRCDATRAMRHVEPLLRHGDDYTRWWICEILSECPTAIATEVLIQTALSDPDVETRSSAVCALSVLESSVVVPTLRYIRDHDLAPDYEGKTVGEIAAHMLSTIASMDGHELPSGIDIEQLRSVAQRELALRLPDDFIDFMKRNDGFSGVIGQSYLQLFPCDSLIESNSGYQGGIPAEKLLIFATDGGGELFAIDARHERQRYIMVNSVGWEIDNSITLGQSYDEFLRTIRDGHQWSARGGPNLAGS